MRLHSPLPGIIFVEITFNIKRFVNTAIYRFGPRFKRPLGLERLLRYYVRFARQFFVQNTLSGNLREQHVKALAVVNRLLFVAPIVEAKTLFVQIPEQVERLDAHIGSVQISLKQAPEIFESVRMHSAIDVPLTVVHDLMDEVFRNVAIRSHVIGEQERPDVHMLCDERLHGLSVAVRNDDGANLFPALKHSKNDGLIVSVALLYLASVVNRLMHVARFATDKGFVNFDFAAKSAKF